MRQFLRDPVQRSRLWFGLAGALTGLIVAAVLCEPLFALSGVGRSLARGGQEPPVVFATPRVAPVAPVQTAPPPDIAERLAREQARTGDVQISLAWENGNDLDLACISPYGEKLSYQRRFVRSGGVLDVDMNANSAMSMEPVENIYWPPGRAPLGRYEVYVKHYKDQGGRNPTAYRVEIYAKGQRRTFTGSVMPNQTDLVSAFTVTESGSDLGGAAVTPPPDADAAVPRRSGVLGAFLVTAVWAGLLGALLPLALFFAQWLYLRQPPVPLRPAQIALMALRGLALGALSGVAAQALFTLVGVPFPRSVPFAAYLLGWSLLGCLLGLVVAALTPNVPRRAAFVVGTLSAALAGAVFLPLAGPGDGLAGRFLGATLIGGAIGLTIALRRPDPPVDEDAWLGSDRFGTVRPQTMGHRHGSHTGVLQPPRASDRRSRRAPPSDKSPAEPTERKSGRHRWRRRERK